MVPAPLVLATRGSVHDGLGHVMRSRAVAEELKRLGEDPRLLVLGDESSRALLQHSGLPFEYCPDDHALARRVDQLGAAGVVFDMLRFDAGAFERIAKTGLTVSLSPVFNQLARVGHLFHRTTHEDPAWSRQPTFPRIHKGLDYAIVGDRCRRIPAPVYRAHLRSDPLSLAISMGGADAANRTREILRSLSASKRSLLIWVVLGEAYTHSYEDLVATVRGTKHEVILVKSNESMWRVLQNSCLLICSSGLTPYEAAYAGLPTIVLPERPEAVFLVRELEEKGACLVLPPGAGPDQIRSIVEEWEADREKILARHVAGRRIIRANGTHRVAQAIRRLRREFARSV